MTLRRQRLLLSLAIIAASVCLALGVSLPIIRLNRFVFWSTDQSLLSTVRGLVGEGQLFLAVTIFLFCVVFPALRLVYLLLISALPVAAMQSLEKHLQAAEWLGKWSMPDVLALALAIFLVQSQGMADASSLPGIYFFTAAVVLMIVSQALLRIDTGQGSRLPSPAFAPPLSTARSIVLSFFIVLAAVLFALGITLPVVRFTTVYVWSNEHSIVTVIYALFRSRELVLSGVLFAFSIAFPFLKLFHLAALAASPGLPPRFRAASISAMEWLGRCSMTDVMVLALLIAYVNASGYTEASMLPGVYFFAASVLITMLAYGWAHAKPGRGRTTPPLAAG